MEHISNQLATASQNQQVQEATKKLTPLPTSESEIRQAIQGRRIKDADNKELDQMFRSIFMLIGLRPQFMPNDLEAMFLYQFVQDEYKNHTTSEVVLAFKKVATGHLREKDGKIIELYDYFTPAYFGKVMTLYREWASEIGNKVADEIYVDNLKKLDMARPSTSEVDWRAIIEQDYQFFLSNIDASTTYPENHYNTLAEDGLIEKDIWKKRVVSVKTNTLRELNKELVLLQNSKKLDDENSAHTFGRLMKVKETIERYASGERDADFESIAKQRVVAAYFKYNMDLGNKNIYVPQ